MPYDSLINTLYLAQRDIIKTFKYTQRVEDSYKKTNDLDGKFREKLEDFPQLKKLYEELDDAHDEYVGEIEFNAYYYGFKSGLQIAIECACKS